LLGDATTIRAACPRRQKTDKRDARHILNMLVEDRFPVVWQPSVENDHVRQLLLHRCRLVRMRTRIKNQLDSIAKNEGLLSSRVWSPKRRGETIEALPLLGLVCAPVTPDLLGLLDECGQADSALGRGGARGRRRQPGGPSADDASWRGSIAFSAYVLTIGDWRRFPRGSRWEAIWD